MALLNSGQVLIGGNFSLVDYFGRAGLAQLNASGGLDPAFAPEIHRLDTALPLPVVDGLLVQPDGKILFSGSFGFVNLEQRLGVARINPDTTLDSTFNPSIDPNNPDTFRVLGLQADGKVIVYRQFSNANGDSQRVIARLNGDGSLDSTFGLALQPGLSNGLQVRACRPATGRTMAGRGEFRRRHGCDAARHCPNQFERRTGPFIQLLTWNSRKIWRRTCKRWRCRKTARSSLVARSIESMERSVANSRALTATARLDISFVPVIEPDDPQHFVAAVAIQDDGKILIGGFFTTVNGEGRNGVARLNDDGSLDQSFDVGTGTSDPNGAIGRVLAIAVQPDEKIILGGDFAVFNGQGTPWVVRLNSNGSVETGLAGGLNCLSCDTSEIRGVAILKSGHIMISGVFNRIDGRGYNGLARLLPDGSVDPAFLSPATADEQPDALAVASDDKTIIAVLSFDPAGGVNRTRLVRLDSNGILDGSFKAGDILSDGSSATPVSAIEIDDDDRIIIGGAFTSVGGTPRRDLARLKSDGTLDTDFEAGSGFANGVFNAAPNFRSRVTGIARQDDGGIIVGGNFSVASGQLRLGLARFQAEPPNPSGGSRPVIHSPARAEDGTFSMTVSGEPGRAYRVEASTDLRSWTTVGNVTGAANAAAVQRCRRN